MHSPDGMNCYAAANHVRRLDFKTHAKTVTERVLAASRVERAKARRPLSVSVQRPGFAKDEAAKAILGVIRWRKGWRRCCRDRNCRL